MELQARDTLSFDRAARHSSMVGFPAIVDTIAPAALAPS
jgi:hypothetical protein